MYYEIEAHLHMKSIIFDDDKLTVGEQEYPYAEIEEIELESPSIFATYGIMKVHADGKINVIPYPRGATEKLRRAIRDMERIKRGTGQGTGGSAEGEKESSPSGASGGMDPYEEAKKLKELLDLGIITQEEFERKKKEILGL